MIKFLKAMKIKWEKIGENNRKGIGNEVFINVKQIMTLEDISANPGDGQQKAHQGFNTSKSSISTGNDVYYSELPLNVLLEKCDIEVVE